MILWRKKNFDSLFFFNLSLLCNKNNKCPLKKVNCKIVVTIYKLDFTMLLKLLYTLLSLFFSTLFFPSLCYTRNFSLFYLNELLITQWTIEIITNIVVDETHTQQISFLRNTFIDICYHVWEDACSSHFL